MGINVLLLHFALDGNPALIDILNVSKKIQNFWIITGAFKSWNAFAFTWFPTHRYRVAQYLKGYQSAHVNLHKFVELDFFTRPENFREYWKQTTDSGTCLLKSAPSNGRKFTVTVDKKGFLRYFLCVGKNAIWVNSYLFGLGTTSETNSLRCTYNLGNN